MIFLSEILFKLKHCYLISSSCPTPKRFFTDSSLKPIWHSRYNVHFWINDNHNEEEELPEHPINKVWPMTVVIRGSLSVPSRVSFFPNLNHNLPKNVVYDCNPKTWSDGYHFCKFYFEIPNVTEECFVNLLLVLQNTADKYKHSYRSALKYPPVFSGVGFGSFWLLQGMQSCWS